MFFGSKSTDKQTRPGLTAALDIGSGKIVCFIGRKERDGRTEILGAGQQVSRGIKAGAVVDMEEAEAAIRSAVEKAERAAQVTISSVSLAVGFKTLKSHHLTVETPFSTGEISDRELRRLIQTALAEFDAPDQALVHALPINWTVDGESGILDPRGMFGKHLGVDMHLVTAAAGPLRNLVSCVERCHLRVNAIVASSYAAGRGVLVRDEMDLGATIIDMGEGATTVAVFRDQALVYVDVIPVGGGHVTSDISRGLSTPMEDAERIKTLYGSALYAPDDEHQMIECPVIRGRGPAPHEPRSKLTSIIRPRVEETFEHVNKRLARAQIDQLAGRRIVITGSASQLSGVRELATRVFNRRVRMGTPHGFTGLSVDFAGPGFAVANGLLKHALSPSGEVISGRPDLSGRRRRERRYSGSGFSQTLKWFRDHF